MVPRTATSPRPLSTCRTRPDAGRDGRRGRLHRRLPRDDDRRRGAAHHGDTAMSAGAEPLGTLHACTLLHGRRIRSPARLPGSTASRGGTTGWGFATAGTAASIGVDSVSAALAGGERRRRGARARHRCDRGRCAPVHPGTGRSFVIPSRVCGRSSDGRTWVTTIAPRAAPCAGIRVRTVDVHGHPRAGSAIGGAPWSDARSTRSTSATIEKVVLARDVTIDADARSTGPWCSSGSAPTSSAASCSPPLGPRRREPGAAGPAARARVSVSRPMAGTVPVADETGLAHLACVRQARSRAPRSSSTRSGRLGSPLHR